MQNLTTGSVEFFFFFTKKIFLAQYQQKICMYVLIGAGHLKKKNINCGDSFKISIGFIDVRHCPLRLANRCSITFHFPGGLSQRKASGQQLRVIALPTISIFHSY